MTVPPEQRSTLVAMSRSLSKFGTAVDAAARYAKGIDQNRLAFLIFMLHEQLADCRTEFLRILMEDESNE